MAHKLTAAQVALLDRARMYPALGLNIGGMDMLLINSLTGHRPKLVERFRNRGTVRIRLTDAGRAALNAHKLVEHHRAGDVAKLVEMVAKDVQDTD